MRLPGRLLHPGIAKRLYFGLVALVLGGLAWVTAAALSVEAAQRDAALASEVAGKERLALWRLDGQLFAAVAVENSRPFAHYSAWHVAPTLSAAGPSLPGGDLRSPSPLLSAELPAWMTLHFQLDADGGWTSPQVPTAELADRLRNSVELANVTPERAEFLDEVRRQFPTTLALAQFSTADPATGTVSAFAVPAPDIAEASLTKPPDGNSATAAEARGEVTPTKVARENPLRPRVPPESAGGLARSNSTVVPPEAGATNSLSNRAPPQGGPTVGPPNSNSDEYAARARAANPMTQRPGVGSSGGFGGGQTGYGTSQGGFGGGAQGGYGGGQLGSGSQNVLVPTASDARNGVVTFPAEAVAAARAQAKGPPTFAPLAVHVGPMRAEWLTGTDGQRRLALVRAARLDATTVYQGVLLDWPFLDDVLREQVADLFPHAVLTPVVAADTLVPERAMTALPVQLDPGPPPDPPRIGWTPLRLGVLMSWGAVLLAVVAVGLGGHALLDLSERRIRFVAAVSHELRTPLTTLRLYLDLLTSGLLDNDEPKRREYLNTLVAESERLHRLVENVLDFARLENRAVGATLQAVPVCDLLATVEQTWALLCAGDGKTLVVLSLVPPGQCVLIDAGLAGQVLSNLIDNARKYTRDAADNRVWVWAKPGERGRVHFAVEDRGPGVPASERGGVFEPFRRGDGAEAVGGAGLGLSLARHWATQLGGRLTYRVADGGTGACFRLSVAGVAGGCAGVAPEGPRL